MEEGEALSLWNTRHLAEQSLAGPLKEQAAMLLETFGLADHCIDRLEAADNPFGRVCVLVLIKARNLALGCYSLSLDALAQESGALFRPLLESLEMLIDFRLDPTRIDEALNDHLPSAGRIAKKIAGHFQDLREYLNEHASHLSVSPEAMKHLFDAKTGRPKRSQPFHVLVLRENLHNLLAVLVWIAIEAVNCVCRAWGNTTCSGRACNGSQGANVYAISGVTECRVIVPKFRPPTVTLLF